MADIVERLRESADRWLNEVDTRRGAANEITRLRARIVEHEQFRHQHRDCNAMGVENQSLRAERDDWRVKAEHGTEREAKLIAERDALRALLTEAREGSVGTDPQWLGSDAQQAWCQRVDAALAARGGGVRDAMISIPVGKYNELADLVVELTTRHKALIETNESLAARLAEAGSLLEAVRKGKAFEHDRYLQTTAKLMKAEALLSELYDCGAVTNWLRVSDDLRKRVIEVVRATASARAVQEPPADVFDAMNLPAVGFPTTGEK